MNIILIGYRGSGKSTIGRKLAKQLWKTFVDVDEQACMRFDNQTIAQIWSKYGEPAFREVETQVTCDLCEEDNQVIALGGGTLLQPAASTAVEQAKAIRIYLKCTAEELWRRIRQDDQTKVKRPSLTGLGGGVNEIHMVLEQREAVYLKTADTVFDVTHLTPDDAVQNLVVKHL